MIYEEAKTKFLNILKDYPNFYNKKYINIYASYEQFDIKDIKDCQNNNIFNNNNKYYGWLFFIDPYIMKNWAHRCEYWFFSDNIIIKNLNAQLPPLSMKKFIKL